MMKTTRSAGSNDLKCIVADDVRVIREQFGAWLEGAGFSVIQAGCGATALRAIRRENPNLVVTDIDMPEVSGLNLLQTLRVDPDRNIAAVPVIVASSLEDHAVNRLVCEFGRSAYMTKPVDKVRFLKCVEALLAGTRSEEEESGRRHHVSSRFRIILADLKP